MDILIIGSVAYDTIETPFGKVDDALGGSGTYFSLAASYFTKPKILAVVGEDFKDSHLSMLEQKGVDVSAIKKTEGKTFRWGGKYGFDLNNRETLFTELNVFENFNPVLPDNFKTCQYLFLGNIHPALQNKVLQQAQGAKFVGLDSMNLWIENSRQELLEVLKRVNIFIINDSECRELSQEYNLFKAANKILGMMDEKKDPALIIKQGEFGLFLFKGGKTFHLPAFPLENVFDPTGAGDSFAGGFMGFLAKTGDHSWENLKRASVAGSIMASFCVEQMGAKALEEISQEEIANRFSQFKQLTHFEI